MADSNLIGNPGRILEEDYLRRKEQELNEKLCRRAEKVKHQRHSQLTGIADDDILQTLYELGYTRNTVALLHLVPLIQVGWTSGRVTDEQRELILEAARLRGIEKGSASHRQLESWFGNQPSEDSFEKTLRIISLLVKQAPETHQTRSRHGLFTHCVRVAAASGEILGFGSEISDKELRLLENIAQAMVPDTEAV